MKSEKRSDVLIIRLSGELDHHEADQVRQKIDREMEEASVNHLAMDLSGMEFMDSSGVGMLIGRYKRVSQANGHMVVTGVSAPIARICELSGLFKIIRQVESVDAFVAEMEGK